MAKRSQRMVTRPWPTRLSVATDQTDPSKKSILAQKPENEDITKSLRGNVGAARRRPIVLVGMALISFDFRYPPSQLLILLASALMSKFIKLPTHEPDASCRQPDNQQVASGS